MVTEQGRPSTEVAKELGICIDTLRSWLKAAGVQAGQADPGQPPDTGAGSGGARTAQAAGREG